MQNIDIMALKLRVWLACWQPSCEILYLRLIANPFYVLILMTISTRQVREVSIHGNLLNNYHRELYDVAEQCRELSHAKCFVAISFNKQSIKFFYRRPSRTFRMQFYNFRSIISLKPLACCTENPSEPELDLSNILTCPGLWVQSSM